MLGIGFGCVFESVWFCIGYMGYVNVYMVFGMLLVIEVGLIVLDILYGVGVFDVVIKVLG